MMEKIKRKCQHCGTVVENPDINYCPNCENILWYPKLKASRVR